MKLKKEYFEKINSNIFCWKDDFLDIKNKLEEIEINKEIDIGKEIPMQFCKELANLLIIKINLLIAEEEYISVCDNSVCDNCELGENVYMYFNDNKFKYICITCYNRQKFKKYLKIEDIYSSEHNSDTCHNYDDDCEYSVNYNLKDYDEFEEKYNYISEGNSVCIKHAKETINIINLIENNNYGFCEDNFEVDDYEDELTICGRCKYICTDEVYTYKEKYKYKSKIEERLEGKKYEIIEKYQMNYFIELCKNCKNHIISIYA